MTGFFLLLGHLLGDFIVQNDWMASGKTIPHPGPKPVKRTTCEPGYSVIPGYWEQKIWDWEQAYRRWRRGHTICTVHCLLYTLAVWLCTFWWMPWWGLVLCFAVHWPIDRFRLAHWWMTRVSGQGSFATGPLSPWSVIVVDQVAHLATLGAIAALAGVPF